MSIVSSEMLKLSRNNHNIKMLGVPPNTLPLVIYIGLFCYWVYYITCHSKQLPMGLMVLSDGMVHFLKIKKNFNKSTKTTCYLVAIMYWAWQFQRAAKMLKIIIFVGINIVLEVLWQTKPSTETRGAFHQAFCQCFSLTTVISYWNPCIWLAESKFVSEKHW